MTLTPGVLSGVNRTGLTAAGLAQLTDLGPVRLWLSSVGGAGFDLRAQLLVNDAAVATAVTTCVGSDAGTTKGPTEVEVNWPAVPATVVRPGDVIALRIAGRASTSCTATADRLTLHYGAAATPSQVSISLTGSEATVAYMGGGSCALALTEEMPAGGPACTKTISLTTTFVSFGTWALPAQCACDNRYEPAVRLNPPAPEPEAIELTRATLPPAVADTPGACTTAVNPHRTGCVVGTGQVGGFFDAVHYVALLDYVGAPDAPDPASVYRGTQLVALAADGSRFATGDPWLCLTCGIPAGNTVGSSGDRSYPQPFTDGRRVLLGANVLDCGPHRLLDEACTPEQRHVYPIRWDTGRADGRSGNMRELRINPDGVHLGWNHILLGERLDQFTFYGRLVFDPNPTTGVPRSPRYDLVDVSRFTDTSPEGQPFRPDPAHPGELLFEPLQRTFGEFRGWSKDGSEGLFIGHPVESGNFDIMATNLFTGATRRVTANPEYVDPVDLSPVENWAVVDDTRGSDRTLFVSGLPGVPPLVDLVTTGLAASVRNDGQRRYFQPYLIDRYGDRGTYQGQQLNAGDGAPGSFSDPAWNALADPRWSLDGTRVVYWQSLATGDTCGNPGQSPCGRSDEPGGARTRIVVAHLPDRSPVNYSAPAPLPDAIAWAVSYKPGDPEPVRPPMPAGTFTLRGASFGTATVTITQDGAGTAVATVAVAYDNYSDDGVHVLNGTERVQRIATDSSLKTSVNWHSDLHLSGCATGRRVSSEPEGFTASIDVMDNEFIATGTLTTTLGDRTFRQPSNER